MNEISKVSVRDYRQLNKDSLRHVLCIASQCSYNPPPMAYLETVRLNLSDETRGLELGLLPLWIRQRRQEHVRKIVHIQELLKNNQFPLMKTNGNGGPGAPFKKETVLAVQSIRSSQASKLFAELLARDAAVAAARL
jgi:hypothetical protein